MGDTTSAGSTSGGGCLQYLQPLILALAFGTMIVWKPSSEPLYSELEGDVPHRPFIGHALELMADQGGPNSWLAARCREHGAVSRLYLTGEDVLLLCGAAMGSLFGSDQVDHDQAASRSALWLGSPHRVPASRATAATTGAAYAAVAADRLKLATAAPPAKQDGLQALLAVADTAGPVDVGQQLLPHMFKTLWRTLFSSDGAAIQETYLQAARDLMSCVPLDTYAYPGCFRRASASVQEHILPALVDEIRGHRVDLGPVLGGAEADDAATAAALHELILRVLHTSAAAVSSAFYHTAAAATDQQLTLMEYPIRVALESRRLSLPASWSFGVVRSEMAVSVYHANTDCHADCPSCSTPCEPYTAEIKLPAGTKLLQSWSSLGMDSETFEDPETFSLTRPAADASALSDHVADPAADEMVAHIVLCAKDAVEQGQLGWRRQDTRQGEEANAGGHEVALYSPHKA